MYAERLNQLIASGLPAGTQSSIINDRLQQHEIIRDLRYGTNDDAKNLEETVKRATKSLAKSDSPSETPTMAMKVRTIKTK